MLYLRLIILFIKYKSLNCSIVYSATKQNSIKVPQDVVCAVSDGNITGTTFEAAKADISMVKRQVYALTQALISAGIINNSQSLQ